MMRWLSGEVEAVKRLLPRKVLLQHWSSPGQVLQPPGEIPTAGADPTAAHRWELLKCALKWAGVERQWAL